MRKVGNETLAWRHQRWYGERLSQDGPLDFVWSWPDIDPAFLDPSTVTVSRDPDGRWYVSLMVDVPDPDQAPATGALVGVDLGLPDRPGQCATDRRAAQWPELGGG